MTLNDRKLT